VLRIEPAGLADLPGVYRVCLMTDDAGGDSTGRYWDQDLPGHVFAGPYLAWGRETQLVVVDRDGVAGYLLSTDDTLAFDAWAEEQWWPPLRVRYPLTDERWEEARFIRRIHAPEHRAAELLQAYPAHFHIDLLPRTRGSGMGRRLIERLLSELRERGVPGLHMGVDGRNTNAIGFYEHLGFRTLEQQPSGLTMGMSLD
jgi:ribosomal protein S18 acetylase RimI-like enzyme